MAQQPTKRAVETAGGRASDDVLPAVPRYGASDPAKSGGIAYTPEPLAAFLAERMVATWGSDGVRRGDRHDGRLTILDPAAGEGALLLALVSALTDHGVSVDRLNIRAFETEPEACSRLGRRLATLCPRAQLDLRQEDFLDALFVEDGGAAGDGVTPGGRADFIIANPPYVRTQVLGGEHARRLAQRFNLSGRVDLSHAFLLAMVQVLAPDGVAGVILSNRFMTTRSGADVRRALIERFDLRHVFDLGDTKLFDVAVLPALIVARGRARTPDKAQSRSDAVGFTSIYQYESGRGESGRGEFRATDDDGPPAEAVSDPVAALTLNGRAKTPDGRQFDVRQGYLDRGSRPDNVWRNAEPAGDRWLATVAQHQWGCFGDVGKIRVGIKTCADRVFIRSDWASAAPEGEPELLRPLLTHHRARRYAAAPPLDGVDTRILYPHERVAGVRRAVDLARYPFSLAYLEAHRTMLEARRYVLEAGRAWYEIWVPQDPAAWSRPKLVFRDIAEQPVFWIDHGGAVVNGDCYWLMPSDPAREDLLWLAVAVGNSTFTERFYDLKFHNKLYSGRRRFITQYVETFPLPDPAGKDGERLITLARSIHDALTTLDADRSDSGEGQAAALRRREIAAMEAEADATVWRAFGGH